MHGRRGNFESLQLNYERSVEVCVLKRVFRSSLCSLMHRRAIESIDKDWHWPPLTPLAFAHRQGRTLPRTKAMVQGAGRGETPVLWFPPNRNLSFFGSQDGRDGRYACVRRWLDVCWWIWMGWDLCYGCMSLRAMVGVNVSRGWLPGPFLTSRGGGNASCTVRSSSDGGPWRSSVPRLSPPTTHRWNLPLPRPAMPLSDLSCHVSSIASPSGDRASPRIRPLPPPSPSLDRIRTRTRTACFGPRVPSSSLPFPRSYPYAYRTRASVRASVRALVLVSCSDTRVIDHCSWEGATHVRIVAASASSSVFGVDRSDMGRKETRRTRRAPANESTRGRKKRWDHVAWAVKDALRRWLVRQDGRKKTDGTYEKDTCVLDDIQDDDVADAKVVDVSSRGWKPRNTTKSNGAVESFETLLLPPLSDPRDAESPRVWKDPSRAWYEAELDDATCPTTVWERMRTYLLTKEEDLETFGRMVEDATTSMREALVHMEERALPSDLHLDLSAWFPTDACPCPPPSAEACAESIQKVWLTVEEQVGTHWLPFEDVWRGCVSYLSTYDDVTPIKTDPSSPPFWDAPLGQLVLTLFGMDPPTEPRDATAKDVASSTVDVPLEAYEPHVHDPSSTAADAPPPTPSEGLHDARTPSFATQPRSPSPRTAACAAAAAKTTHERVQVAVEPATASLLSPNAPGAEGRCVSRRSLSCGRVSDVWQPSTRRLWRGIPALSAPRATDRT